MVRIVIPLLFAIPVLSQFVPAHSVLNGLVARQTIDPSNLPSACQSSCQVVNTMTDCNSSLSCICTSSIGSQLEACMTCLVDSEPTVESQAQSALDSWNSACNGNLSLGSSSSGGSTTSSSSPSTSTGTSSSGGSSPSPLGTSNAVGLNAGNTAVFIVAALFGAFITL